MEHIQPYLDYFSHHPGWAIAIVFLIAFGEALLIIGLFVPSTAVLVGAGILVGSGNLPFWPVFIATAVGAFAGDQVSFWVGRLYGANLKNMWPLRRYPQLVARGEDFVRGHGGKSIAIGRFVPGVKAVVPGIVGMLGMGEIYFASVNASSALVWTALHVFPGILIGQGLALAGELSGRLAFVLLELLVLLAVGGWVIRLVAAGVSPYLDHILGSISNWARASRNRPLHRFGRAISPENPRSLLIVFFGVVVIFGFIAFMLVLTGVLSHGALANADISVMSLMRELRNAPADAFLIPITMLGDAVVAIPVMVTIVAWLLWHRAWRAALASTVVFAGGKLLSTLLKLEVHRLRPGDFYSGVESFSFPSGHTTTTALTFGVLAVLASHAMSRWSRSLVYAACGIIVITIAYTRVYLGAHWLTDVLGGVFFGVVLVAAFGMAIEAIPPRRIKPLGLMISAFVVFVTMGTLHINRNLAQAEKIYAAPEHTYVLTPEAWRDKGWAGLPQQRIDLAGKPEEKFTLQWAGPLSELQARLVKDGWTFSPKWTWRDSLPYLDLHVKLDAAAPRPALHQGLKAKLTLTHPLAGNGDSRLVLRAFKTDASVKTDSGAKTVYLVSLTEETLHSRLKTYVVPILTPASADEQKALIQQLSAPPAPAVTTGVGGDLPLFTLP
jgi:undecaprenyl-diphosphatase